MKEEIKSFRMRMKIGDGSTVRDEEGSLVSIETVTVRDIQDNMQRDTQDSLMRDILLSIVLTELDKRTDIIHAVMRRETEERDLMQVKGLGRGGNDMELMGTSRGKAALLGKHLFS